MKKRNLLPIFIYNAIKNNNYKGTFKGIVISADICNFTPTVEKLMSKGKNGAEIIGTILHDTFGIITDTIYFSGGFISSFSGDAFTAIFPENVSSSNIRYVLKFIEQQFENRVIEIENEKIPLLLRVGVASGKIEWGIIGEDKKAYYFKGDAIYKATYNQHMVKNGKANIEGKIKDFIGEYNKVEEGTKREKFIKRDYYKNIDFYPEILYELSLMGEFREVISMFVFFEENIKESDLKVLYENARNITDRSGGYFNKIEFGDKGGLFLIIFGAPISTEDMIENAVDVALKIYETSEVPVSIGMDIGVTYAGFLGSNIWSEYTVIGDSVNASARIGSLYKKGVFVSEELKNQLDGFEFEYNGKVKLKGKKETMDVFGVKGRKTANVIEFNTPFTGRTQEIKTICDYINSNGKLVFLSGESGIGKTRLVYETVKQLGKVPIFVFSDPIIKDTLYPIKQFLAHIAGKDLLTLVSDGLDSLYAVLDKLNLSGDKYKLFINYLFNLPNIGYIESLEGKERREGLFYVIKDMLFEYAKNNSNIVVIFDDAMWMDEDTQSFLKHIFDNNEIQLPVTVFILYRENTTFLEKLRNQTHSLYMNLNNFSYDGVKEYAESVFGKKVSDELANILWERTAGNPLYLEQIILHLIENNLIEEKQDVCYIINKEYEIPSTLNRIIVSRLDRLSPDARDGVQRAAVIGKEFDIGILEHIIESGDVRRIIDEGNTKKILTLISKKLSSFRHSLLHETAYEMQLKERLKNLHRKVASVYEKVYENDLSPFYEVLYYHYDKAGDEEKSSQYLLLAAQKAVNNYSNEKAMHLLEILLQKDINEKIKKNVYLYMGDVFKQTADYDEAEDYYMRASQMAGDDKLFYAKTMHRVGNIYWEKGNYDKALNMYNIVERIYKEQKSHQLPLLIKDIAMVYFNRGDYKKSREELLRALEYDLNEKDKYKILGNLALVSFRMGEYDKTKKIYDECLSFAAQIDDKNEEAILNMRIGLLMYEQDKWDESLKYYEKALQLNKEIGNKRNEAIVLGNIGTVYMSMDENEKSLKYLTEALDIDREIGNLENESIILGNIANAYGNMGEYDRALEYYKESLTVDRKIGSKWSEAIDLGNMGELYKKKNDYKNADKCFAACIDILEEIDAKYPLSHFMAQRADLLANMEEYDIALELTNKSKSIAKELGKDSIVKKCEEIEKKINKEM